MPAPSPPTAIVPAELLCDILLLAGRHAQQVRDDGYPELSLRAAVNHAAGHPVRDPRPALGALADYLAPGWRSNAYWVGGPGEVVDAWQKRAARPLDVAGVLGLAAVHTSTAGGAP